MNINPTFTQDSQACPGVRFTMRVLNQIARAERDVDLVDARGTLAELFAEMQSMPDPDDEIRRLEASAKKEEREATPDEQEKIRVINARPEMAAQRMAAIHNGLPSEDPHAGSYAPDQVESVQGCGLRHLDAAMEMLFQVEQAIQLNVRNGAVSLSNVLNTALKEEILFSALDTFSSQLTEAFGAGLRGWATGSDLRPLGHAFGTHEK